MQIAEKVESHYTRGNLEQAILQAIAKSAKADSPLSAGDLAGADEFHVGGIEATRELAGQMALSPGMHLLDVGCGVGGPARYFADEHKCRVTGIDLTQEFVEVAQRLTRMVGLERLADFRQADARRLTFDIASFDRAYMIHVGMNIEDKAAVYREVRRVLKPGGLFAIFDVMRVGDGEIVFPLPWAQNAETSFVGAPADYGKALESAGFAVERERRRGDFSIEFTERALERLAQSGPPVLGLQLLMGANTPLMLKNVLAGMKQRIFEPIEIFARAV